MTDRPPPGSEALRRPLGRAAAPTHQTGRTRGGCDCGGPCFYVDPEDLALAEAHDWRVRSDGYVVSYANGRTLYLHREVMRPPAGMQVDHVNGDRTDNRRSSLRVATRAENQANRTRLNANNSSGYRGVYWSRKDRRWVAQGAKGGRRFRLGGFATAEEAARVARAWRLANLPGASS